MKNTTLLPATNGVVKSEKIVADKAQNRIMEGLRDLFLDGLKDIYGVEKALLKALPKMIKNANSDTLKLTLTRHLEMGFGHIIQLESVFDAVHEKPKSKKCAVMTSLIHDAEKVMDNADRGIVRDAALVSINRKIRYHTMANYSVAHALAMPLVAYDAAVFLRQNFEEEKEAEAELLAIAQSFSNADVILTNQDIAVKKRKHIAANNGELTHPKTPKSDVLHPHLAETGGLDIKVIRIVEVQYLNSNGPDLTTLTQSRPTNPLSIKVNFDAISK